MGRPTSMTPEIEAKARRAAQARMSIPDAAALLGVSESTLRLWAKTRGVVFGHNHAKRHKFNATVMTQTASAKAREMAAKGMSKTATAKALGVRMTTVDNWSRRTGVTFVSAHGASRYGLSDEAAETYRLARRKGFTVDEALSIAGARP